jgi:hypothetical protein
LMSTSAPSDLAAADIPVVLEFGPGLEGFRADRFRAAIERRTAEALGSLLQALRLPGRPRISLRNGASGRAIRIRVHGALQPFPPCLLRIAWLGTMPPPLRTAAEEEPVAHRGYSDGWLTTLAARPPKSDDISGLPDFLAEVTRLVIAQRPSCLLPPADPASGTSGTCAAADVDGRRVAATLLDLGVPLETGSMDDDRSVGERIERAFERLRAQRIELRVHPKDLERLVGWSQGLESEAWVHDDALALEVRKHFEAFEVEQYALRGFQLPPAYLVGSAAVPSGHVAVKINALLGTPMARIPANVPTAASTSEIPRLRDGRDPPGRWPQALDPSVFMGRRRRDAESGSPPWVGDVVIPALNWAVEAAPERLMGLSDAEHLIAKFEAGFPDLVRAALKEFSLPDLTMVLRMLVRDRVCIRDLRTILEALLQYEWVGVDIGDRLVFDERVVLPEDIAPDVAVDLAFRVEAPLRALATPSAEGTGSDGNDHRVIQVERALEVQFERAAIRPPARSAPAPLSEADRERLLDQAWSVGGGKPLIVITSAGARTTIRELLAAELSAVTVLAQESLHPDRPPRRLVLGDASPHESAG